MPPNSKAAEQEIALAIRGLVEHLVRMAQGIRDYAAAETGWRIRVSPETHDLRPT